MTFVNWPRFYPLLCENMNQNATETTPCGLIIVRMRSHNFLSTFLSGVPSFSMELDISSSGPPTPPPPPAKKWMLPYRLRTLFSKFKDLPLITPKFLQNGFSDRRIPPKKLFGFWIWRIFSTDFGVLRKIATARSKTVRFSSNFHQILASACKIW